MGQSSWTLTGGPTQRAYLGIHRSDYMLHVPPLPPKARAEGGDGGLRGGGHGAAMNEDDDVDGDYYDSVGHVLGGSKQRGGSTMATATTTSAAASFPRAPPSTARSTSPWPAPPLR